MSAKEAVKIMLIKSGRSLTDLVKILNEQTGKQDTPQNLSNKLSRGSLRYNEAEEIADALGYTIEWVPKQK